MITRRKKLSDLNIMLSASLALLTLSTPAWAGGKKRPSEVEYSRTPIVQSASSGLQQTWKKMDEAYDRSAAEVSRAADHYLTQLRKAEATRLEAQSKRENAQRAVDGYRITLGQVGDEIRQLSESKDLNHPQTQGKLTTAQSNLNKINAQLISSEKEARELEDAYYSATAEAEKLRSTVNQTMSRDFNVSLDPNKTVEQQLADLKSGIIQQRKLEGAARITDQFLDRLQSDYLKSGLLVSDINALKTQRNFTDQEIQSLQEKLGQRLDNTMLGRYIDQKVNSCDLLNKMAVCNATGINAAAAKIPNSGASNDPTRADGRIEKPKPGVADGETQDPRPQNERAAAAK